MKKDSGDKRGGRTKTRKGQKKLPEIVAWQDADLDKHEPEITAPIVSNLPGGRRVEVWTCPMGLCLRLFTPTLDGKLSKLAFGLYEDSARALATALVCKLLNASPGQPEANETPSVLEPSQTR